MFVLYNKVNEVKTLEIDMEHIFSLLKHGYKKTDSIHQVFGKKCLKMIHSDGIYELITKAVEAAKLASVWVKNMFQIM